MSDSFKVVVIGGGLAGLTCARYLCDRGIECRLFEASDSVGGRIRTDKVDGFLLDRGFQVFLNAYPEARNILNYNKLRLNNFEPGALIRFGDKFHRLSDPWRRPKHIFSTALSPIGTLRDKLGIAHFRKQTTRCKIEDILTRPQQETISLFHKLGFSETVVERFLRPFLGGVFLDRKLETSSRMCEFVFRMFALGDTALPDGGMEEIPKQLASELPSGVVSTSSPIDCIKDRIVSLHSGEKFDADAVVIATDEPAAQKLIGGKSDVVGRSVTNLYFAAHEPPIREPILVLNGERNGLINNFCVPSQVSPSYAPSGQSLISVSVLGGHVDKSDLTELVRNELKNWFGNVVSGWRHLRTYSIPYALPIQNPDKMEPIEQPARLNDWLYICGDYRDTGSINGAMSSGRRAAEEIINTLE